MIRCFVCGFAAVPALFGFIWILDEAAGTRWALPVAAMVLLTAWGFDLAFRRPTR